MQIPQRGVLVVFDRADTFDLFQDTRVIAAAKALHLAMLYAYQCNAKTFDDLQPDAATGPGRALFQALNQFAISQSHPELATASVFLTGFSASAVLSVTTGKEFPSRTLGIVAYAPGSNYVSVINLDVTPQLAKLPTLVLVSDQDTSAGDQWPYFLFSHGYSQGGPWGFGSQHNVGHCCADSIAPLLVPWMTAIFNGYTTTNASGTTTLKPSAVHVQPTVSFQLAVDGYFDVIGWQDFYVSTYSLSPSGPGHPDEAWLPDSDTTQAWINWTQNPNGN